MQQAIIGIPSDVKMIGKLPFHAVGDKYIAAAAGGAGGLPLLIPSLGDEKLLRATVALLDGVLLPGSPSNVEPHHYGGPASRQSTLHDPQRDATTLPLIRLLLEEGVPLLGICRGFQEINVALGGELHQHVQEQPGLNDHREADSEEVAEMYAPSHAVSFVEGGLLAGWTGQREARVNSLHQQGIKRLAPGLDAEAHAEDGLVEAYRIREARAFAFAVQWHPEWRYWENPLSQAIFSAFGDACRARRAARG
ncbi:gamma-glutamyl-gamma-aminobutyrate hydrolase family protein [Chromobacterium subtsugae]|uniref:Gamma-glutamyl-gamma-aminobutyrate hydrolase family protein n=1 Tax=Chromobacterium subtsugae TaxID=251747 RepID=A0ABS7FEY8_9NEIS|nr:MULTISPECIES: gamma-glutamyl-gamma-aminobutyrate hydrolase family protein [Chromobacterium]KUM03207.1 peptidase C26 [Chromobacterium subtsugae]KZE88274.1 peptidase C26 [Chromobacterium sp. F49]MBW7565545.1 gamma-glutamyl-gamma-aminobutyrate hydrolase family protein [Chromobacterium subtsugae]MBW8287874.1 gamma-glutamyl-gamma-aminobutyrate hydrolase family protein [Chromobacterium subtsugae]WSE89641.1 gamma-glutamyl-gamma-aminobutyrate hydrolase family protein [Chromobacterium subtsugae]